MSIADAELRLSSPPNATHMTTNPLPIGRRLRAGVFLIAALVLAGCGKDSVERTAAVKEGDPSLAIRAETGVVLSVSKGPKLTDQCSRSAPTSVRGYFSPTARQIARLEAGLAAAVNPRLEDRRRGGPISYHRQYMGIVHADGSRWIYVNAFPSTMLNILNDSYSPTRDPAARDTVRWRVNPLIVCDGGSGLWGIEYDVKKGVFANFAHNGQA